MEEMITLWLDLGPSTVTEHWNILQKANTLLCNSQSNHWGGYECVCVLF